MDSRFEIYEGESVTRQECERRLASCGVRLAVPHQSGWVRVRPRSRFDLVVLRDGRGRDRGAFGLEVTRSRALPTHFLLRAERFGANLAPDTWRQAVGVLSEIAKRRRRVVRVSVEVFVLEPGALEELNGILAEADFLRVDAPRSYVRTLLVDMRDGVEAVWKRLSRGTRYEIRAAERVGASVRQIEDPELGEVLGRLTAESFTRTGGSTPSLDWRGAIEFSVARPQNSRLVGLWIPDDGAEVGPVAYAWGWFDGEVGTYSLSGSTRSVSVKLSLIYPLLWDLVTWTGSMGARWFDLGGAGGIDGGALHGIAEFKLRFSKTIREVGAEWAFEPRPFAARLADVVSGVHRKIIGRGRP